MLLQRAHGQLTAQKQAMAAEIARIDALKEDHQAVTAQLAALYDAMGAFKNIRRQHANKA